MDITTASATGPASIGNVAVGFDILGICLDQIVDKVHLTKRLDSQIVIQKISGTVTDLPTKIQDNTCGAALLAMQERFHLDFGFDVEIEKGIPLASGMGGSAASAVAAVVAANEFLPKKLSKMQLLEFALQGEGVASGAAHLDNVSPSLLGGLCLCTDSSREPVIPLPFPGDIHCLIFHQNVQVETKSARQALSKSIELKKFVQQSQYLAGFISGCYEKNIERISDHLKDIVIEPQRSQMIPHFDDFKQLADSSEGALGCSISGAGPSIFALTKDQASAESLKQQFDALANKLTLDSQSWVLKINPTGAQVL